MNSDSGSNLEHHRPAGSLAEVYHHWKILFWLIGLVVLVWLFYAEENWRGYRAWTNYKQRMAAKGEVTEPAGFIPPTVPDEQNFAMTPSLAPLFEFVPGTQKWKNPNAPGLFQDLTSSYDSAANLVKPAVSPRFNSWVRSRTDLNQWAAAFEEPMETKNRRHKSLLATNFSSQDAAGKVLKDLSDFDPLLDELRAASSRPFSRFNLRYEEDNPASILLPHLAKIKYMCQVLHLRASAHLALGQTSEALQDLDLLFYLANTSRTEPVLISQLVRMAEVQMAFQPFAEGLGQWSETQLRQIQDQLARFDFCVDTSRSLQAEKVLLGGGVIEYFRRSHHKMRIIGEFADGSQTRNPNELFPAGALYTAGPGGWLYLEQLNYNQAFDKLLTPIIDAKNHLVRPEIAVEADTQVQKIAGKTISKRLLEHEFFTSLLLPSIYKAAKKTAFAQSGVDTAALACALERYRLVHGQFPDSLARLSPEFIAQVPHDIINGKPLTYRLEPDGHYLLYSVGWNQTDDNGQVEQTKSGETEQNEGDWVWSNSF